MNKQEYDLLVRAKNFLYEFECIVPLYLALTKPHLCKLSKEAAVNIMSRAIEAQRTREEIENLILAEMRKE